MKLDQPSKGVLTQTRGLGSCWSTPDRRMNVLYPQPGFGFSSIQRQSSRCSHWPCSTAAASVVDVVVDKTFETADMLPSEARALARESQRETAPSPRASVVARLSLDSKFDDVSASASVADSRAKREGERPCEAAAVAVDKAGGHLQTSTRPMLNFLLTPARAWMNIRTTEVHSYIGSSACSQRLITGARAKGTPGSTL